MNRNYTTLNQAKLFKEKGFNLPCSAFSIDATQEDVIIERPEQWQVIEWLFDNHNIYIHTTIIGDEYSPIDNNSLWCVSIYKDIMYKLIWGSQVTENVYYFKSKKEGLSAAFDYILNNLI